jgi:hypothetical protein
MMSSLDEWRKPCFVEGVLENDHVDYQAECAQLVFLPLAVALVDFAALAMKNTAPQAVPAFAEIELLERASPARSSSMKLSMCMVLSMRPIPHRSDEDLDRIIGTCPRRSLLKLTCAIASPNPMPDSKTATGPGKNAAGP